MALSITKKTEEDQKLALFERALRKTEKNMASLSMLIDYFKQSGYDSGKYAPQFQDMMGQFAKLLREFSRTEYEYEGPYNSEQSLERYKASVSGSWKHKPEKDANANKPITEDEIKKAMQERADKMEALAAKRQQQALLEGKPEKPMITGPDGKTRYDFAADAESSDEEDGDMINRVLSGDVNPGKHDTNRLKSAHMARLKNESMPMSRQMEQLAIAQKRDKKLVDKLKKSGNDYQDRSLDELEDVHTMQKSFLAEEGSDEEDAASIAYRRRKP